MTRLHCNKCSHSAKFDVVSAFVNAIETWFIASSLAAPNFVLRCFAIQQLADFFPNIFERSLKINLLDHTNISFLCILITEFLQYLFSTASQKVNVNEYKENTVLNDRRTTFVNKCERHLLSTLHNTFLCGTALPTKLTTANERKRTVRSPSVAPYTLTELGRSQAFVLFR
jgi:hypothetical protein